MIFIKTQNNGALINFSNCKSISLGTNENSFIICADECILGNYTNINDAQAVLNWIIDEISKDEKVLFIPTLTEENNNAENDRIDSGATDTQEV